MQSDPDRSRKLAMGLFAWIFGLAASIGCAKEASDEPLLIEVTTDKRLGQKPLIHGFNTNFVTATYGFEDPTQLELLRSLRPATLRFPGGWLGEYYHWKMAGFSEPEISAVGRVGKNAWRRFQKKEPGGMSFDAFMRLAEKAGVRPVINVNLATGTPAESAAWVKHAKDRGYDIAGWELGNELYGEKHRDQFPDVDAYIRVARQHADAMRREDSGIKIAAVATPAGIRVTRKIAPRYERWDRELGRQDFFDAYVVHVYPHLYDYGRESPETLRSYLMAYVDYVFSRGRKYYEEHYGDRPVWITEWNLLPMNSPVTNTRLHAAYCGAFAASLIAASDWVEIAHYHVLTRTDEGFPLYSPSPTGGPPVKRACFYPLQLAGEMLVGLTAVYPIAIPAAETLAGGLALDSRRGASLQAVAGRGPSGQLRVLIASASERPVDAKLLVDGRPESGRIKHVSFMPPGAGGKRGEERSAPAPWPAPVSRELSGPSLSIPPFSVNFLVVE